MATTGICPVCKASISLASSGHIEPHKHRQLKPSSPDCPGSGAVPMSGGARKPRRSKKKPA